MGVAALHDVDHGLLPRGRSGGPGTHSDIPEIVNTDPGGPCTRLEFTGRLKAHDLPISLDGTGGWHDHVFVERRWKRLK